MQKLKNLDTGACISNFIVTYFTFLETNHFLLMSKINAKFKTMIDLFCLKIFNDFN